MDAAAPAAILAAILVMPGETPGVAKAAAALPEMYQAATAATVV
jgi:hypothetical protein